MTRIRRLSAALMVAGVLGVAAPAAASAMTTITISGATASYPLVSLLAQKYVKLTSQTSNSRSPRVARRSGVNDVAAGRVTIGDVSRDPLTDRSDGAGLLPDRQVRDLRRHQQSQPALEPDRGAAAVDLHRQGAQLEPGRRRHGDGHDRPDQPPAGRRRADELPDAPARRQEGLEHAGPKSPPRACSSRPSKTTHRRSASCRTTRPKKAASTRSAINGVACNMANAISGQYAGRGALLRGDQGQGHGRRVGVHRLDRRNRRPRARSSRPSGSRSPEARAVEGARAPSQLLA